MEITEVRIKLMENAEDRLRAFCSVTFDNCFVIRDLKIIEGHSGPFVAMPSRKLTAHCRNCNSKNHLRARFCNQCGKRLTNERIDTDSQGRAKLYADIAHPINADCRERIQNRVVREFLDEFARARLPGYVSRYDDDYEESTRYRDVASAPERPAVDSDPPESLRGPHTPGRTTRSDQASIRGDQDDDATSSGGSGRRGPGNNPEFGNGIL